MIRQGTPARVTRRRSGIAGSADWRVISSWRSLWATALTLLLLLAPAAHAAESLRLSAPVHPPASLLVDAAETIVIDDLADVTEWWGILANRDNVTWDGIGSGLTCPSDDADCGAMSRSFDLRRVAWTYDREKLCFYVERQDGTDIAQTFLYLDENDDGLMSTSERVVEVLWVGGSLIRVVIREYSAINGMAGDPMLTSGASDGHVMPGSVDLGAAPVPGGLGRCENCATPDGRLAELCVPWSSLLNPTPRSFGYHVESTARLGGAFRQPSDVQDSLGGSARTHSVRVTAVGEVSGAVSAAPGTMAVAPFQLTQGGNIGGGEGFRVAARSEHGQRLEIHEVLPFAQRLAIDINGDGDFDDAGDEVFVDADGDGWPDTSVARHGESVQIAVHQEVPGDAVNWVDRVELWASPERAPERREMAVGPIHGGWLTVRPFVPAVATPPGESGFHLMAITNHGTADAPVSLSFTGGRSYAIHTGDPGRELPGGPDSLTFSVTAGETFYRAARVDIGLGDTPGDVDEAVLAIVPDASPDQAVTLPLSTWVRERMTLLHEHALGTTRGVTDALSGGLLWFPHEAINASTVTQSWEFFGLISSGDIRTPLVFSDPNGDGNPEDGVPVSLTDIPPSGRYPIVIGMQVGPTEPVGTGLALDVTALRDDGEITFAFDEAEVTRATTLLSSTHEVQVSHLGPCEAAYPVHTGTPGSTTSVAWEGPAGPVPGSVAVWHDALEQTRSSRRHQVDDPVGTWTAESNAGPTSQHELESAASFGTNEALLSDGGSFQVITPITCDNLVASIRGARLHYWVMTPGATPRVAGGRILRGQDDGGRVVDNDGTAPTWDIPLTTFEAGADWIRRAGYTSVDWSGETDMELHAELVSACGEVITSAITPFSVPSVFTLLRRDPFPPAPGVTNTDVAGELVPGDPGAAGPTRLDPVADLYLVDPMSPVIVNGEVGTSGALVFYELNGSDGPLFVRRSGDDVVLSGW